MTSLLPNNKPLPFRYERRSIVASLTRSPATASLWRRTDLNFYHINIGRSASCSDCLNEPSARAIAHEGLRYVNILDFPKHNGVHDLARVDSAHVENEPFPWFADLRYTWRTPIPHHYPNINQKVLSSLRVQESIDDLIRQSPEYTYRYAIKKAADCLNEIRASLSRIICRFCGWGLFKVFRRVMKRLLVCPNEMERLQQAEKSGIPIIYLPLHRSHLDYLIITFTAWHWNLRLPHVASGDNLNMYGFGWLLRGVGSFFIRRRLGENDTGGREQLYRSVLKTYMIEILKYPTSIEFFLEGTRSRYGKTLLPKNGLISNIVEAVQSGELPDAYLVPVSFTYDQTVEGIFFDELLGSNKKRESIWGTIKGVYNVFGVPERCGSVRVNFGAPRLLSDYMQSLTSTIQDSRDRFDLTHSLTQSGCYRELLPWHNEHYHDPQRTLIRAIGYHVVYSAQNQSSISLCSLMSSLLLCKYRNSGAHIADLRRDLEWLVNETIWRGFDVIGWEVGHTHPVEATNEALSHLVDSIVYVNDYVSLKMEHKEVLNVSYQRNAVIAPFSIASAVALAFVSKPSDFNGLVSRALQVCNLLQMEVIFCKPCQNLHQRICDEVNQMIEDGLLETYTSPPIEGHEETGDLLRVVNKEHFDVLTFYANILRPFLQTLYVVVDSLLDTSDYSMGKRLARDKDFARVLLAHMKTSDRQLPFRRLPEAFNSDSINNSVKLLREKKVITQGSVVQLDENDGNGDAAKRLLVAVGELLVEVY
ncbi:hypothetical protein QR680_006948 [Steinernema hermaphroditum]|uniref:Phospholipid/glycerol acyltransferase domain-containing protein n=1 Tax=Steinernema hermaphroditum TaxID=289476 RepID=A0AA39HZF6_9BILA|nr:hypothetical protein QR680_006948 [Steinernema hermaphroditum]